MAEQILQVAAYCRVSTDKEDQLHSLEAQRQFFEEYVQSREGWHLEGIYADEGLSGTAAARRPRFMEMVDRALLGKIGLIITKEVSRFARNTVDALEITRRLKEKGVGVVFLTDGIDTRDSDGEFRLTIMASVAQEESRKISQRTRWGQLQAMRRGVVFGNDSLYGYTLREGKLCLRPRQAAVVREIYRLCLEEGEGAVTIARRLTAAEIPPPRHGAAWSAQTVLGILHNEKYCGDLVQKKYRTVDYLTHRKVRNRGEEEQLCLPDHHPAVISREMFQAVQAELQRRAGMNSEGRRHTGDHWYSGKLRCGLCGRSLAAKTTRRADGSVYSRFICRGRGEGCALPGISGALVLACARYAVDCLPLDRQRILEGAAAERDPQAERQAMLQLETRRRRAVEAYLEGQIGVETLQQLEEQCRTEAAAAAQARENSSLRSPVLRQKAEQALTMGEAALREAIEEIVVEPGAVLVRLWKLPAVLRLEGQCRGRGAAGWVEILSCCPIWDGDKMVSFEGEEKL